jgi:hypothetical protein
VRFDPCILSSNQACTSLTCICTDGNAVGLATCVGCIVSTDPSTDVINAAQEVIDRTLLLIHLVVFASCRGHLSLSIPGCLYIKHLFLNLQNSTLHAPAPVTLSVLLRPCQQPSRTLPHFRLPHFQLPLLQRQRPKQPKQPKQPKRVRRAKQPNPTIRSKRVLVLPSEPVGLVCSDVCSVVSEPLWHLFELIRKSLRLWWMSSN